MKLVQKILSHGLLIGFFVATFFTYLYRAELFPQWFGDTARTASSPAQSEDAEQIASTAVQEQQVAAERNVSADTAAPVTELSERTATDTVDLPPIVDAGAETPAPEAGGWQDTAGDLPPLATAETEQSYPQQPAEQAATAAEQAAVVPPAGEPAWESTPPPRYRPLDSERVAAPPLVEAPQSTAWPGSGMTPEVQQDTASTGSVPAPAPAVAQAEAETVPSAAAQVEPAPATVTQAAAVEAEEVTRLDSASAEPVAPPGPEASDGGEFTQQLELARGYFWRRDLRGAVQAYQQLTAAWPAQPDAWGELGNLYFRIGNRQAAAEAYSRTISILLDQGESDRAAGLLEVLYGLDSGRASELEKRFRQVSS